MHTSIAPRDRMARAIAIDLPDNEPYILLPEALTLDLRDQQLAVGIYLLIARSYLVHQAPIPLSAADIEAYDGGTTLRRGAILRALDRLCAAGWLLAERRRGQKATYLPAWGIIGGAVRPWDLAAAGLRRPRTVRAVRVPRVVLDVCLGRLTPHHRHVALVERYVSRPPISLRDLGAYGLLWAGMAEATLALTQLGLAGPTGPLAPPSWSALLARISQRPLIDTDPEAPTLSERGLQRAGLISRPAAVPPEETPLFFVPPDMIGRMPPPRISDMIPDMIGLQGAPTCSLPAAERAESQIGHMPQTTTATQGNQSISENQGTPPTGAAGSSSSYVPPDAIASGHGSKIVASSTSPKSQDLTPAAPADPPTAAEQTLRALGVYPSIARRYRDISPDLIDRAATIAERLPRRNSLPATLAYLLSEELASPGWLRQGRPDLFLGPMPDATQTEEASSTDLRTTVHSLLCDALAPDICSSITPEQILIDAGTIVVEIPAWFCRDKEGAVDAALEMAAGRLGLRPIVCKLPPELLSEPAAPAVVLPAVSSEPATTPASRAERPDWIDAEAWGQLHLMARSALAGSHWEGEGIIGSSPGITRILRTRLADLVARLCAPGEMPGGVVDP